MSVSVIIIIAVIIRIFSITTTTVMPFSVHIIDLLKNKIIIEMNLLRDIPLHDMTRKNYLFKYLSILYRPHS